MEQQILRMEGELQREYGHEDWSMTFRAGPESIAILAECILITSRSKVIGIELKGPGLKYMTLSANVNHCADIGADTFRKTARNMKMLAHWTDELSQPNGTIEKMLRFCEPGQSEARDRLLSRYIARSKDIIKDCTDAIEEVKTSFDGWYASTTILYHALQDTLGQKRRQEKDVKNEMKKYEADKECKENQKKMDDARLKELRESIQKVLAIKEWCEDHAALVAFTVMGSFSITSSFILTGTTVYMLYRIFNADLLSKEEAQERRQRELCELEVSKANTKVALAQLSMESKSIDEVAHIVRISIKRVTELQQLVRNFMEFLLDIHTIINHTVKRGKFVYGAVKDKEDLIDPSIKKELLDNAFDMKTRFIFASQASDVYNMVSSQHILPLLNMLPELGRLNQETDDEVMAKIEQLHDLRSKVCSETRSLAKKMHEELKKGIAEVTRTSARIFEDIESEDK